MMFKSNDPMFFSPDTSSERFTLSLTGLMSPVLNSSGSDLPLFDHNEHKPAMPLKMEVEDAFSPPRYTDEEQNMEIDIGSATTIPGIKTEIEYPNYSDMPMPNSVDSERDEPKPPKLNVSEAEARKIVLEKFEKIAFVPSSNLSQRDKIKYILAQSDCTDFTVDEILNFDKRSASSARACAKIVQNIPQHHRWECVEPKQIPCCYTIVADCKKVSSRGGKPPRPMNAFMIWAQGARRLINELCPKMQNALISEALGFYWRQKSDEFKKKFEEEKIKLRQFHNEEFPAYKYKPKTKVQKAKEKQELSLSKAKSRATVKKEKISQDEESNLHRRKSPKYGRPPKIKAAQRERESISSPAPYVVSSEIPVKASPTKSPIKTQLSLKIRNDMRSREAVNLMQTNIHDQVHSAFGQLSPLEVVSPGMGDIFENIVSVETVVSDLSLQTFHDTARPPSVYDTPANTPPVDSDDEVHLSPIQTQRASVSPPLLVAPNTPKPLPSLNSSTTTTTSKQMLMPSLSAMLASPTRSIPCSNKSSQCLQLVGVVSQPIYLTRIVPTNQEGANSHLINVADPDMNLTTITTNATEDIQSAIDFNNNDEIKNFPTEFHPTETMELINSRLASTCGGPDYPDLESIPLVYNEMVLSENEFQSLISSC